MKHFIVILAFSFMSFAAMAQQINCLDKLLPFSRHSGLHHLAKEEWSDGRDTLTPENVKIALRALVTSKLFCKPEEVTIKIDPVCQHLSADISESNACYVYTNVGYFFVTRDNGKNTNFIFSKDKRFASPTL
jgi:hypothetical protein